MVKHGTHHIEHLISVHWPAGTLFGVSACVGIRYGTGTQTAVHMTIVWLLLIALWVCALLCCMGSRQRMHRLIVREQLADLCQMHWRAFENRIANAFRYRGYAVEQVTGEHVMHEDIDNGLDLIVHKHGLTTLVQCRHWRNSNVEVKDVREMYSLMKYHHASAVKIVARGDYTNDAWKFVAGKPFELIYGETLLTMLSNAQLPIDSSVVPFRVPASPSPMHHRPSTAMHT
ncbi:restriction endonuclease [Dyella sp. M7H15-1]|uniref:restriction endonuclease n=1 Tax=Dyella sp. M7H15-1 TaxID=2501295 RepID=UPI00100502ED|nr:restriction endonuclease [Dyella sp. M7H15-1]QAU23266.1 restriction endonuclease [Dyella sp. M7H15-1]